MIYIVRFYQLLEISNVPIKTKRPEINLVFQRLITFGFLLSSSYNRLLQ